MESRSRLILLLSLPLLLLPAGCAATWPFGSPESDLAKAHARADAATQAAVNAAAPRPSPYANQSAPFPAASESPSTYSTQAQYASAFAPPGAEAAPAGGLPPDGSSSFTAAQIIATIGNQYILYGDVEGIVNLMLAPNLAKLPAAELEQHREEIAAQKQVAIRNLLEQEIQTKLVYLDFIRTIPREKLAEVQKRVDDTFQRELEDVRQKVLAADDEQIAKLARSNPVLVRLALIMKQQELETIGQLDVYLRRFGSSLDKQKRTFGEFMLAQMMIGRNIKQNVEITHEQMLQYYRDHAPDYAVPAQARWEQLTVRFDRFPGKDEAYRALAEMGNQVYLGGAPLAAVAKRGSQEPNADQGGYHDWTSQGSLASTLLDDAIFSLPINRLSQIIEDPRGYHILRVVDRSEATKVPFTDAQGEIKEKIKLERRQQDVKLYLERLQKSTPVWRYFDPPNDSSATASREPNSVLSDRR